MTAWSTSPRSTAPGVNTVMSSAIPTTYADAKIQTDRLGELHQCLMAHGFRLQWVEDKSHQHWTISDSDEERREANTL